MKTMTISVRMLALVLGLAGCALTHAAAAQEAPDALVKRITQEVLALSRTVSGTQQADRARVRDELNAKVMPNFDFARMTRLAAGPDWRRATPEQQTQLTQQFRALLLFTYSGAIGQAKGDSIQFEPTRGAPDDPEVIVRTQVTPRNGEPFELNYRLEKQGAEWKIYDVDVSGAWLVETYQSTFTSEISRSGVDGLIKALTDKNKTLASR